MPKFSDSSLNKLGTCHNDIKMIMQEVIKNIDCQIIYGNRTPEEQFNLFKQGRVKNKQGEWVIFDSSKVVTYKDGYKKLSKHNSFPSMAIDVVPFPIDWIDKERFAFFAGYVISVAHQLKQQGKITHDLVWGADWDSDYNYKEETFKDYPHFELK